MNMEPHGAVSTPEPPAGDDVCRVCTRHLEMLCYRRAWWFRAFRELLAAGVRLFAFVARIRPTLLRPRSPYCHACLRFRKNALKRESAMFCRIDARINPIFNHLRDALLTPEELERARALASRTEDPAYRMDETAIPEPERSN